jgi:UDP-N-acetylglucosamine 2-epimerase (non-hydrolysing)
MSADKSKILVVYGTRPEAIKMAPVVEALRARADRLDVVVCATAQHREMLDQVQEIFDLRPDVDLDLMQPNQALNDLTSRAIAGLDRVLRETAPDWLLVQGDTTTAMAGGLAAFHRGVRIGHVEAGLRSGDLQRPFPEEANRRIIDVLADALFAPTALSRDRLIAEGAGRDRVFLTGNTVIDALYRVAEGLPEEPPSSEVLVTVHRRESFGAPLREILAALRELALAFPENRFILPVHKNPKVTGPVHRELAGLVNFELVAPLSYRELVRLMRRCRLVLTDSGGVQEEAPAFGKPVLVLRERTERPEGVDAGVALLVGTERARIVAAATLLLSNREAYLRMSQPANPYGDGRASERIAAIIAGQPWTELSKPE